MSAGLWIRGAESFQGDPAEPGPDGDLYCEDGLIAPHPEPVRAGTATLDATGCLVLPGFVIAHHHLYSALARGMPSPPDMPAIDFVDMLTKVWWRLDRALDLSLVETSALVGSAEALRCGVTGIVDHHASPSAIAGSLDAVARGMERAGVRGVVCYEATDRHGDDGFAAGLAENARFLARSDLPPTLRGMVGGHAPFTLSDDHLRALASLGRVHGAAVHLHAAEAVDDQHDAQERWGAPIGSRLERTGVLAGRTVLAHGVHLGDREIALLRESGTWLTHQPRSNMNNHVGYLASARAMGRRLALGTDGIDGDLLAEAHAAFFRLRDHDGTGAAESVWSWLAGGWRLLSEAFGLPAERAFGRLTPGSPADLVVLDYDAATPVTAGNLPWHLAFGIGSRHVRDVVVAGRVVVRDRRPMRVDPASVRRDGAIAAQRLWQDMKRFRA